MWKRGRKKANKKLRSKFVTKGHTGKHNHVKYDSVFICDLNATFWFTCYV